MARGVNVALYVNVSLLVPVPALCVFVCLISNQSASKNNVICDNADACCLLH